jgi:hypothetical protein
MCVPFSRHVVGLLKSISASYVFEEFPEVEKELRETTI